MEPATTARYELFLFTMLAKTDIIHTVRSSDGSIADVW
jgi:hypothetical protein